jgi:hypothetical protein
MDNDISKKPDPYLPSLPMLGDLLPDLPPISPNDSFLKRVSNSSKARYLSNIAEKKAEISAHNLQAARTNMDAMISVLTFRERYDLELRKIQHEQERMDYETYIGNQQCQQESIKTEILRYEMLTAKLIYEQQLREVEGDNPAQDREE